jgi:hypothetical protein
MDKQSPIIHNPNPRQRGSVYVLVLGASLLVAVIGVSSLMAARVQRRAVVASADMTQASELARSALDWGLWEININPGFWRMVLASMPPTNVPFAGGTYSLTLVDPIDGNLTNNNTDPVVFTGIGKFGSARFMLEVTLNGDGSVQAGTWKRVVQ